MLTNVTGIDLKLDLSKEAGKILISGQVEALIPVHLNLTDLKDKYLCFAYASVIQSSCELVDCCKWWLIACLQGIFEVI